MASNVTRRRFLKASGILIPGGVAVGANRLSGSTAYAAEPANEVKQSEVGVVYTRDVHKSDLMEGFPPPRDKRVSMANWFLTTGTYRWTHLNSEKVFHCIPIESHDAPTWVLPRKMLKPDRIAKAPVLWGKTVEEAKHNNSTVTVDEWLMRSETDAFLVLHDGHIIAERYFGKATPRTRHHLWSASRSYLAIVAAQYLNGPLNKTTRVTEYIDELRGTGFEGATIQNLLDQNTSLDYREFPDPDGFEQLTPEAQNAETWGTKEFAQADHVGARMWRAFGVFSKLPKDSPDGAYDFVAKLTGNGKHGKSFAYKDANSMVLQWILERVNEVPYEEQLGSLWRQLGPEHVATLMLDGVGTPGGGFGLSVTARDFARFGQMLCNKGIPGCGNEIPGAASLVDEIMRDPGPFPKSPSFGYRNHFWTGIPGNGRLPQMSAYGGYMQRCFVDSSRKTVVVWLASFWNRAPDKIERGITVDHLINGLASFLEDVLPTLIA